MNCKKCGKQCGRRGICQACAKMIDQEERSLEGWAIIMAKKRRATYLGIEVRSMPPTLNHRPAIWECMLGTVYAMNDQFKTEYFDYNYDKARAYAGVAEEGRDPRSWRCAGGVDWTGDGTPYPTKGDLVLWVLKK